MAADFIIKDGMVIIPHGPLSDGKGDMHDTYKIDRYGNLYNGHMTVRIPGGEYIPVRDLPDIDQKD